MTVVAVGPLVEELRRLWKLGLRGQYLKERWIRALEEKHAIYAIPGPDSILEIDSDDHPHVESWTFNVVEDIFK